MKWGAILGITLAVAVIALYEWPKMNLDEKKEKAAFIILSTMGLLLAVLLAFYPELPGQTELVEAVYKPLSKLIGK